MCRNELRFCAFEVPSDSFALFLFLRQAIPLYLRMDGLQLLVLQINEISSFTSSFKISYCIYLFCADVWYLLQHALGSQKTRL